MRKPNFLVFVTDQQRADWLGCYGHPVLRTPHIDALAARGTRFEEFHTALPVCMPNRASLLTGRYPSVHGLRHNGCVLSQRANTFVDVLAAGGYRTAAIGKSHLQPFTGIPPKGVRPFESGPIEEAWKPEPFTYDEEEPDTYDGDRPYAIKTPYYGYQHVEMVTGHGDRCGGHYGQWFRRTHANWRALHDPANELPHNYRCAQAYRTPVPEDSYPTAWIRDRASEWLRAQAGEDTPFFAFVSFPDPHHPFNPPGRYWSLYEPEQFDIGLPYAAHRNPPPPLRRLREKWERGEPQETPQSAFYTDDQALREAMALTAGMTAMIDDAVGDVMAALQELREGGGDRRCFHLRPRRLSRRLQSAPEGGASHARDHARSVHLGRPARSCAAHADGARFDHRHLGNGAGAGGLAALLGNARAQPDRLHAAG